MMTSVYNYCTNRGESGSYLTVRSHTILPFVEANTSDPWQTVYKVYTMFTDVCTVLKFSYAKVRVLSCAWMHAYLHMGTHAHTAHA